MEHGVGETDEDEAWNNLHYGCYVLTLLLLYFMLPWELSPLPHQLRFCQGSVCKPAKQITLVLHTGYNTDYKICAHMKMAALKW